MPEKVFCHDCREDVEYTVEDVVLKGRLRCGVVNYTGKEARCNRCGHVVYLAEINDYNLEVLQTVIKTKKYWLPED